MTRGAICVHVIGRGQRRKRSAVMWTRDFARIDEFVPQWRRAEDNQEQRKRRRDNGARESSALQTQARHQRTFWNWTAACSVRQRPAVAGAFSPRATPASFRFAGFDLQNRFAFKRRLATAFDVGAQAARL